MNYSLTHFFKILISSMAFKKQFIILNSSFLIIFSCFAEPHLTAFNIAPGQRWETARDQIRAMRKEGKLKSDERATVIIKAGDHFLPVQFELGPLDSYTTYRAEKGARVIGGKRIPLSAFKPWRNGISVCDAKPYLLSKVEEWPDVVESVPPGPWLYLNGEALPIARWPNKGWAIFTNATNKGIEGPGAFEFKDAKVSEWAREITNGGRLFMNGYWTHDWADAFLRVDTIDTTKNEIKFAGKTSFGIGKGTWGANERRFYALNLLSELDAEGEWYLDRKELKLYVKLPAAAQRPNSELILASYATPLIYIRPGTRYANFECLTFGYSHSKEAAFVIDHADYITIDSCAFRCTAGKAIDIFGTACLVYNSTIRSTGGTALQINGGDRRNLIAARNLVTKCDIAKFGVFKPTFQPAAALYGCGNAITHCKFHDGPYIALWYYGNEHLISDNEFCNVVLEAGDSAAIYSGRDASSWGNIVMNNYIHDLGADSHLSEFRMGVYLDDCDCGDAIIGNKFERCGNAVFIGGGNGILVANNIIKDTRAGIHVDTRGLTWQLYTATPEGHSWWHNMCKTFDYRMPPWSLAYPSLSNIIDHAPNFPSHNFYTNNLITNVKTPYDFDKRLTHTIPSCTNYTPRAANAPHLTRLDSANGQLSLAIAKDATGRVAWQLKRKGRDVVALSPLGVTFDGKDWGRMVVLQKGVPANDITTIALEDLISGKVGAYLDLKLTDDTFAWRWRAADNAKHHVLGELSAVNVVPPNEVTITFEEAPEGMPQRMLNKNGLRITFTTPFQPTGYDVRTPVLTPWTKVKIKD